MDKLAAAVLLIGIVILAACGHDIGQSCKSSADCRHCDGDTLVKGICTENDGCKQTSSEDCKVILSNPDATCSEVQDFATCIVRTDTGIVVPETHEDL
jgi:hypothetical protein